MSEIYRCRYERCPHGAEPCGFEPYEVECCSRSTVCPIGEDENFGYRIDTDDEFFLLIVGTRTFADYATFVAKADQMLSEQVAAGRRIVIVTGGAAGADSMAERYAHEKGYQLYVFEADWEKNSGGYERNKRMHEYIAKQHRMGVLAFWDGKSKGTSHSFALAKKYGNPIKVFNYTIGKFQRV